VVERLAIVLLTLWTLGAPPVEAEEPSAAGASLEQRIDDWLRPYVEAEHLSGTVLVAQERQVLYEKAFGLANRELAVPNTPATRHCIASITKPMTVIIAARLIERGQMTREDPLSRWIPDFPSGEAITIDHLLTHRAGIPHRLTTPAEETLPRTATDMVERARTTALLFEPGSQESYSSGGFSVLALVLERASGQPYSALLEKHVFAPAGMENSAHADARQILPGRASSYGFSVEGFVNAPLRDLSFLVGAGSVYSTASDLHALMRTLVQGGYGEVAREALMRENGLRWNGITNQYRAFADYHVESGLHVVLASNLHSGAGDRIRADLPRLVAGEEVAVLDVPHPTPVQVSASALRRCAGEYQLRPGRTLGVRVDGDSLRIGEWLLIPTSETTFFSPQDYSVVSMVLNERGEVERLDWRSGDNVTTMPRVITSPD
jgi:CubicO group peptidase (beta-lactamase class C family)